MSDDVERDFNVEALRAALYGEAFSGETQKNGRTLLVVATLTLMTTVFDVGVKSTPLLPLDFSRHPDTLLTFLGVANLALLLSYLLRATSDLLRVGEEWQEARKQMEIEKIRRARLAAGDVDRAISEGEQSDIHGSPDDWWETYQKVVDESMSRIRQLEDRIAKRTMPITMRWLRLAFFGGLPLLAASLALVHTWRHMLDFIEAILSWPANI